MPSKHWDKLKNYKTDTFTVSRLMTYADHSPDFGKGGISIDLKADNYPTPQNNPLRKELGRIKGVVLDIPRSEKVIDLFISDVENDNVPKEILKLLQKYEGYLNESTMLSFKEFIGE